MSTLHDRAAACGLVRMVTGYGFVRWSRPYQEYALAWQATGSWGHVSWAYRTDDGPDVYGIDTEDAALLRVVEHLEAQASEAPSVGADGTRHAPGRVAEAGHPVRWETDAAIRGGDGYNRLLADGWEPFSVLRWGLNTPDEHIEVWFRRRVSP